MDEGLWWGEINWGEKVRQWGEVGLNIWKRVGGVPERIWPRAKDLK